VRENVQVAVAGDVTEAEEMQAMLLAAGIEAHVETQDAGLAVLVAEDDLTAAREALEALTEPDELIAEP
jgi:type III secretory pathway lipoprotein EscJ